MAQASVANSLKVTCSKFFEEETKEMVPREEEDKERNKSSVLQEQERLMQGFTMPCEYISKLRGETRRRGTEKRVRIRVRGSDGASRAEYFENIDCSPEIYTWKQRGLNCHGAKTVHKIQSQRQRKRASKTLRVNTKGFWISNEAERKRGRTFKTLAF